MTSDLGRALRLGIPVLALVVVAVLLTRESGDGDIRTIIQGSGSDQLSATQTTSPSRGTAEAAGGNPSHPLVPLFGLQGQTTPGGGSPGGRAGARAPQGGAANPANVANPNVANPANPSGGGVATGGGGTTGPDAAAAPSGGNTGGGGDVPNTPSPGGAPPSENPTTGPPDASVTPPEDSGGGGGGGVTQLICDAIRAEGVGPIPRGQEGYHPLLDPDGNGVACG